MLLYDENQGRWTIIFRTYAFSGEDAEFVALATGKGDLHGLANLVARETGHYFHQWHTRSWGPKTEEEGAAFIMDAVKKAISRLTRARSSSMETSPKSLILRPIPASLWLAL